MLDNILDYSPRIRIRFKRTAEAVFMNYKICYQRPKLKTIQCDLAIGRLLYEFKFLLASTCNSQAIDIIMFSVTVLQQNPSVYVGDTRACILQNICLPRQRYI